MSEPMSYPGFLDGEEQFNRAGDRRHLYVMLSSTGTIPSRIIRLVTREPYAHASVSLDRELTQLYSFARRRKYNWLIAGLVHEDLRKGTFERFPHAGCIVYEIDVTEEQYRAACEALAGFNRRFDDWHYSFLSVWLSTFHIYKHFKNSFYCSEFTAYILEKAGLDLFEGRSSVRIRPADFRKCKGYDRLVYEGEVSSYPYLV